MTGKKIVNTVRPLAILILAIWAVEVVNLLLGYRLNTWLGLYPRDAWGLIGIATMPFLHGSLAHAAANTVPLIILIMFFQRQIVSGLTAGAVKG